MQAGERVAEHLRGRMALIRDVAHDSIKLFVGHGAAFRHAACVLGAMPYEDIARLSMYHARPVYLEVVVASKEAPAPSLAARLSLVTGQARGAPIEVRVVGLRYEWLHSSESPR